MNEDICTKLDRLANYQAQKEVLKLDKQALIDQVITAEIKARLDEIEAEFAGRLEAVDANIEKLTEEIKEDVTKHGASVRGTFLLAIWNKGRISWDTKRLDDYARYHPEILGYRKQGEPYISIRTRQD